MGEAIAIVVVIGVVFANLIADLLYAASNPRIRYKQRGIASARRLLLIATASRHRREARGSDIQYSIWLCALRWARRTSLES